MLPSLAPDQVGPPAGDGRWADQEGDWVAEVRDLWGARIGKESSMLYLNRKPGEAVIINQSIEVRVIEVRGRTVKLGFTFPPEATVLREEIVQSIEQANRAALAAVHALPGVDRPAAAGTASAFGSQSAVPLSSTEPPPGAPGHPICQSAKTR